MAKSTTRRTSARERARAARLRIDADRAKRDEQIEEYATTYFGAHEARTALLEQIGELEGQMGRAIHDLVDLDEPRGRITQLLDINAKELRRLLDPIEIERARPSAPADPVVDEEQAEESGSASEPVDQGAAA